MCARLTQPSMHRWMDLNTWKREGKAHLAANQTAPPTPLQWDFPCTSKIMSLPNVSPLYLCTCMLSSVFLELCGWCKNIQISFGFFLLVHKVDFRFSCFLFVLIWRKLRRKPHESLSICGILLSIWHVSL